ncbi:hypothetical protein [Burkholderia thailandensis]|uniref:hypothetical protein n=1 Tax=Burkholderia thailandensis TaxID=57975 RepID=UPI000AB87B98|nr:hypothetical protein [Burkholderia thailandensis]
MRIMLAGIDDALVMFARGSACAHRARIPASVTRASMRASETVWPILSARTHRSRASRARRARALGKYAYAPFFCSSARARAPISQLADDKN